MAAPLWAWLPLPLLCALPVSPPCCCCAPVKPFCDDFSAGTVWTACSTIGPLLAGTPCRPDPQEDRKPVTLCSGFSSMCQSLAWWERFQQATSAYQGPELLRTAGWRGSWPLAGCMRAACFCKDCSCPVKGDERTTSRQTTNGEKINQPCLLKCGGETWSE